MDLESEICNFTDDTTLYSYSTSLDDATIRLENDLQKLLTWFTEMECAQTLVNFK